MISANLYQLQKDDLNQAATLLTACFKDDPLYQELIPNESLRNKILPPFFKYYLAMVYRHCEIYADSPALNGIIIVFDSKTASNPIQYFGDTVLCSIKFAVKTLQYDASFHTLFLFIKNIQFLTSSWEEKLPDKKRVHIDLFAVHSKKRGKGLASYLINQVLQYADSNHSLTTVETHNPKNVKLYEHYGFQVFCTLTNGSNLQEYCMVRN